MLGILEGIFVGSYFWVVYGRVLFMIYGFVKLFVFNGIFGFDGYIRSDGYVYYIVYKDLGFYKDLLYKIYIDRGFEEKLI